MSEHHPSLAALLAEERDAPIDAPPGAQERVLARVLRRTGSGGGDPEPRRTSASPGALGTAAVLGAIAGSIVTWAIVVSDDEAPAQMPSPESAPVVVARTEVLPAAEPAVIVTHDAGVAMRVGRRHDTHVTLLDAGAFAPPSAEASAIVHAEERLLIDRARVALRRGDVHETLVVLMSHERRFMGGMLREDRDRLAIEAFIAAGRIDDARERIARYRREHPSGIHRAAIDRLAAELPAEPAP